ncbi:ImmA/IrrE family metallo-endopeptidase [Amycolatopsis anabasis]|uniref:ImmA/IrrE family metallo-endopeptidase n=1 Tax=Amycolatopsis anabasis TaxID=1840409 RepID=UPI00131BE5FE|nr:ImmA/IrrE family metallo-endopeptidase [Amycolatopsis anabasis]
MIDSLPLQWPFDVDRFLRELGSQRGKPIVVLRATLTDPMPCGLLIRTDTADNIFVVRGTSAAHARWIFMHELGHLLLGHEPSWTGLEAKPVFDPREEAEAEYFADRVAARLSRNRVRALRKGISEGALGQLRAAFGSRRELCRG